MVDARILASEWVLLKPEGGYVLKPGAPDNVKNAFAEYKQALAATREAARGRGANPIDGEDTPSI
jgi:hypothetical protein